MTILNLRQHWAHGPQFYPRELAQSIGVKPIIAEQLCRKLRLKKIKCAVGRMYETESLFLALKFKPHLLDWATVQNEVYTIGETQLSLELGSSFPPYYIADPKD
jgi:hypothetical protein